MEERQSFEEQIATGAVAGFLATLPMTVAMYLLQRSLPMMRHQTSAPRKVTMRLARKFKVPKRLRRKQRHLLTALSHFGYGAAAGALYAPISEKVQSSPAVKGTLYGLGLWAGSYRGWLPAINIWNPKLESPMRKYVMILAHIVWGVSTGLLVKRMEHKY